MAATMDWARIAADFEVEGSWRDIYVLDVDLNGWKAVWDMVSRLLPRPVLNTPSYSGPMPDSPAELQDLMGGRGHLAVTFGKTTFNCHFFDDQEIEFDFDPITVRNARDAEDVARFMAMLGDATEKSVILTWENARDAKIACYNPKASQVRWTSLDLRSDGVKASA